MSNVTAVPVVGSLAIGSAAPNVTQFQNSVRTPTSGALSISMKKPLVTNSGIIYVDSRASKRQFGATFHRMWT